MIDIWPEMQLDRYKVHDIEVVVDRLTISEANADRLNLSLQAALKMGNGLIFLMQIDGKEVFPYSKHLRIPIQGFPTKNPRQIHFLSTRLMALVLPAKALVWSTKWT